MELYYWPAERKWGLPSFDVASLHVMSVIKFSSADVELKPTKRTWLSRKAQTFPCLYTAAMEKVDGPENILQYLKLKYFNPDTWMGKESKENVIPFSSVIKDKLLPAVLSSLWLDSGNYTEVTRGIYAKSCQYPLNFIVPQKLQRNYEECIKISKSLSDVEISHVTETLHSDAISMLNLLSEFLGNKDYMFGSKPCSVDALLFSCLAPILKIPLQNNKLQNHLKACANLCQYTSRILHNYFKEELKSEITVDDPSNEDESKLDWVFPVCVATVAMVSYTIHAGLLQATRV